MSEAWMGTQVLFGLLNTAITAWFCMLGGRSIEELKKWNLAIFGDKSNRVYGRWIAPILFCSVNILIAMTGKLSWLHFLAFITYFLAFRMGYGGASNIWMKIIRRAIWSLIWTAACLPYVFANGSSGVWIVYITQVVIGLIVSVLWGTQNPVVAPREEYGIKFFNLALVPWVLV